MTTLREQLAAYGQEELMAHLRRISPADYDDFIGILYDDLDQLVGYIEGDAKDFQTASEDELNREIVRLLSARCYMASHDHDEGGHVDVRVSSRGGKYSWLAEAKLDRGPAYIRSGLDQLCERYARGTAGHQCGGLLVYIQKARCSERFATWRQYLADHADEYEGLTIESCAARAGMAFFSEFSLPRIGAAAPKYRIRHIAVSAFREANPVSSAA